MLVDGNIFYENGVSGTLAGQFSGANGAGAPACGAPGALTAATLFGTTYNHNHYINPLLTGALYQANVVPDWQPTAGSPAFSGAVNLPPVNNAEMNPEGEAAPAAFFKQTCYRGAIGPNPADDWTQGWTTYDSTGAPIDFSKPVAIYNNIILAENHRTWLPDSNYLIQGSLKIASGASLSIAPGVVVMQGGTGTGNTLGTLIVLRGGALHAIGTKDSPIRFTSWRAPGSMLRGDTGGIVINGKAPATRDAVVNVCTGDSIAAEGGAVGYFGGSDWNAGAASLQYVRVEFAGFQVTANNELNSITMNGCGRSTRVDYCESFMGADDAFEWFGSRMNCTHLLGVNGTDDGIDTQLGTHLKLQFAIIRNDPHLAPPSTPQQFGDKGIEADNSEFGNDATLCSGRAIVQAANLTLIGDKRRGPGFGATASPAGAHFRRGTGYQIYNSIIYNFFDFGILVQDDATWQAHCLAPPTVPGQFCVPLSIETPFITSGSLMVARSSPNPFRNQVNFTFTLPKAGRVSVEVYAADGRHVATVANEEMAAGQHNLTWALDRDTPSGLYFYKVIAGDQQATGKITRVD